MKFQCPYSEGTTTQLSKTWQQQQLVNKKKNGGSTTASAE
jgi:hypothetical protein